ncbi:cytochrome c [bacterium]|nr:cytochrome c [bacterium]
MRVHPAVRGVLIGVGTLVGIILLFVLYIFTASNNRLNRAYTIPVVQIEVTSDSLSISRGQHLAITRGCIDCHGANLAGDVVMDNPAMGYLAGPNLTRGEGGLPADYSTEDWVRAIRHGVSPEGRGLVMMPSEEYYFIGDKDLADLIAYLESIPAVDSHYDRPQLGPVARGLLAFNKAPLISAEIIDHKGDHPGQPEAGPTVEYGAYLATSCTGCHGAGYSGGAIPIGPPDWPPATNLTPDTETGLGTWDQQDFIVAMRFGLRPDESVVDPIMPWANFGQMTDVELTALWKYLQTLPATPEGNR